MRAMYESVWDHSELQVHPTLIYTACIPPKTFTHFHYTIPLITVYILSAGHQTVSRKMHILTDHFCVRTELLSDDSPAVHSLSMV